MKESVGFIGLGNMGLGMAKNLLKAGFPVIGFDVRKETIERIRGLGGQAAGSPFEVVQKARVSILVVLNFDQIEEVVFGKQGMKEGLRAGDILIVSSTIAPSQIRNLGQRIEPYGAQVLDAPISGGKEGAEAGTLSIMVGGQKENYERCLPILQAMGKNIYYLGALGNGLSLKLVNNLLVAVNNLAVAEAVSLGTQAGLDPKLILEVIPKSAGDSWMFRNRRLPDGGSRLCLPGGVRHFGERLRVRAGNGQVDQASLGSEFAGEGDLSNGQQFGVWERG